MLNKSERTYLNKSQGDSSMVGFANRLNKNILSNIIKKLDYKDIQELALVNRKFYSTVKMCWKDLFDLRFPNFHLFLLTDHLIKNKDPLYYIKNSCEYSVNSSDKKKTLSDFINYQKLFHKLYNLEKFSQMNKISLDWLYSLWSYKGVLPMRKEFSYSNIEDLNICRSLKYLYSIPKHLTNLKYLRKIVLKEHEIEDFSILCHMNLLEYIDLDYNKIKTIPKEITNLENLQTLKLNYNFISDISNLKNMKFERLELDGNYIKESEIHSDPKFDKLASSTILSCRNTKYSMGWTELILIGYISFSFLYFINKIFPY